MNPSQVSESLVTLLHEVDGYLGLMRYRKEYPGDEALEDAIIRLRSAITSIEHLQNEVERLRAGLQMARGYHDQAELDRDVSRSFIGPPPSEEEP